MNKVIVFLISLFLTVPVFASATLNQNLYYGLKNSSGVKELQQYLIAKGFLTGSATGNFYTLTLNAVKKFQASKNINQTGLVGPATRQAINSDLPTQAAFTLTGSLDLMVNTTYPNQSVLSPETKFKLADFSLSNKTNEDINLKNIETDLQTDSNLYVTNLYVANLYVSYGNSKTQILKTVSHSNYWSIDYKLPAGQTIDLSVYGDVNSAVLAGAVINASVLVSGVSALSATNVSSNLNVALSGQNVTFGAGSLAISQDSSPATRMVFAGQRVSAGAFKIAAANDSYVLSELKFVVPKSDAVSVISGAVLFDNASATPITQKPAQVAFDGSIYTLDFNINIPIALNTSKSFTIYYDLNGLVNSFKTNINISPVLVYAKATNSGGVLVDGAAANYAGISALYNGVSLPSGGVAFNNLYIFKSVPTFAAVSIDANAADDTNVNLYKFSISASSAADLSVKQLIFLVSVSDPNTSYPNFSNFTFLKGNYDYTGAVAIGNIVNNNYIGLTGSNGVGIGIVNTVVVTFTQEERIPAGKTQTYTIRAHANNFVSKTDLGADSISTSMAADSTVLTGGNYLKVVSSNVYYGLSQSQSDFSLPGINSVLWSDRAASFPNPHNDLNGYYTNDWYNGYNVAGLPLASQTVTAK